MESNQKAKADVDTDELIKDDLFDKFHSFIENHPEVHSKLVCRFLEEEPINPDIQRVFEKKEDSQKAKADAGKPKLTLVPTQIICDIARVREYGNNKYPEGGPDNWKQVEIQRYRDAAFRHFIAYLNDPTGVDEESGLPHLSHLACNIAFLCEMEKEIQDGSRSD